MLRYYVAKNLGDTSGFNTPSSPDPTRPGRGQENSMEAKLIERIALDEEFQAACQRYAHGNGSSMAIAGAALRAAGMPELLQAAVLARDYLHRNGTRQGDVPLALAEAIRATGVA